MVDEAASFVSAGRVHVAALVRALALDLSEAAAAA